MPDPDHNLTEEQKLDKFLQDQAVAYAESLARSRDENKVRSEIREKVEGRGIPSQSFQSAVSMVKIMSKGEREDFQRGVNRVLRAIGDEQMQLALFPEDAERIRKRLEREAAARKAAKEAEKAKAVAEAAERSVKSKTTAAETKGKSAAKKAAPKKAAPKKAAPKKAVAAKGNGADVVVPFNKPARKNGSGDPAADAAVREAIAKGTQTGAGDGSKADLKPPPAPLH
jgi:hypothetical protein